MGVLLFFLVIFSTTLVAQEFQGIATYQTARKNLAPIKSNDSVSDKKQEEIGNMIASAFQKEFSLEFNRNESLYKVVEKLEKPNPAFGDVVIKASTANELLYKNTKENRFVSEREFFGKKFLVKDSLERHDWQIGKETKKIGDFLCTKATRKKIYKERIVERDGSYHFVDKEKDLIVWFAPQIPVSHGPANHYGLPGLILEVEDGQTTYLCTNVVLNSKEKLNIKEPNKGKVVSLAEFDQIRESRLKEAKENAKNRRKNER